MRLPKQRERHDAPEVGDRDAEEERREHDVDEKAGHAPHRAGDFGVYCIARDRHHDEAYRAAYDGARKIQPLQKRNFDANELAGDEKPAQCDEYDDGRRHGYARRASFSASPM